MAATWSEFDCLPTGLKRVYWEAPYDYTAITAFRAYAGRGALRELAAELRASHCATCGGRQCGFTAWRTLKRREYNQATRLCAVEA